MSFNILPVLTIELDPDRFIFSGKAGTFSLATDLYFRLDSKKPILLAIGESPVIEPAQHHRVHLFKSQPPIPNFDKYQCLTIFLSYGISKAISNSFWPVLRPIVRLRGIDKFESIFCGYQIEMFTMSCIRAGAKKVLIVGDLREKGKT